MNLHELSIKLWSEAAVDKRARVLAGLRQEVSHFSWAQRPLEELSKIDDFEKLPAGLRTALIMAATENGFSVAQYRISKRIIAAHFRKEATGK